MPQENDGLWTPQQIAKLLNCHERSVRRWYGRGVLPGYRVPGTDQIRFNHQEVLEAMKQAGPARMAAG